MKRLILFTAFALVTCSVLPQGKVIELSHYVFPEFTDGVIVMKTGHRHKRLMNYNSLTEEMIFDEKGQKLAVRSEEINFIDTVLIEERKFIPVNQKFMELVHKSGYDLLVEHRCKVIPPGKPAAYGGESHTSATSTYSTLSSGGMLYELELPEGYVTKPYVVYWLRKGGDLSRFMSMSQLFRNYKEREKELKNYVKKNNIRFERPDDIITLLTYIEDQ